MPYDLHTGKSEAKACLYNQISSTLVLFCEAAPSNGCLCMRTKGTNEGRPLEINHADITRVVVGDE